MSKAKWFSGPPPSVGWWPASKGRVMNAYRWWDGTRWSAMAQNWYTAEYAAVIASRPTPPREPVEWRERPASWPKRSKT